MIDLNEKIVFLAGSTGLAGFSIMQYIVGNYPEAIIRAAYYKHTKPFIEHKNVEYINGDLRSLDDCRRMVKGCDYAIMAAANTGGAYQLTSEPWKQVNDNVFMNSQLLEVFHFEKIKRVVCVGSATLYPQFQGSIKEEDLDLNEDPPNAYFGIGWVTRYVEKLCDFWHNQSDLEIVLTRTANIFGPFAKFDPLTSNFIPAIIRKAVDKMDPFEVWGSPDVTRDVIYCEDFAGAVVSLLVHDEIVHDVFNVGSGICTRVSDVVDWSLSASGHTPKSIIYNSDKPTTIKSRMLDCSKIKQMTGWEPKYSIEEGIKKTAGWWIDNKSWWKK